MQLLESLQIENALLLTAAELAKKREEAEAHRKAADDTHAEKDKQAGIVQRLKDKVSQVRHS